jgi:magnesium-transporting ATPase (P-type)
METNPYATPAADPFGAVSGLSSDAVSPGTIAELTGTKPWVRLFSIVMWIGTVLMVLGGVVMLFIGIAGIGAASGDAGSALAAMGGFTVMGVMYTLMAFLIIYPTLKLSKYASKISQLSQSRSVDDLNAALAEQRRYWKFLGILTVIYLCIFILGLLSSLLIPLLTLSKMGS